LWVGQFEAGQTVAQPIAEERHAWLHVAEGEIVLNGQTLSGGDAAAVNHESRLQVSASKPSKVLLFDLN
jgi:redox-sensitive bicupin YhaK (pirin superfamily)